MQRGLGWVGMFTLRTSTDVRRKIGWGSFSHADEYKIEYRSIMSYEFGRSTSKFNYIWNTSKIYQPTVLCHYGIRPYSEWQRMRVDGNQMYVGYVHSASAAVTRLPLDGCGCEWMYWPLTFTVLGLLSSACLWFRCMDFPLVAASVLWKGRRQDPRARTSARSRALLWKRHSYFVLLKQHVFKLN